MYSGGSLRPLELERAPGGVVLEALVLDTEKPVPLLLPPPLDPV